MEWMEDMNTVVQIGVMCFYDIMILKWFGNSWFCLNRGILKK